MIISKEKMFTYKSSCSDMKERYDKVVVLRIEDTSLVEIQKPKFDEIKTSAVTWLPPVEGGISFGLKRVGVEHRYKTLHTYGYQGFFKPDLGEILSQLPEEVFKRDTVYLSVGLDYPNFCENNEVDCDKNYYKSSFHRGVVTIYSFV